jgi:hypothetical protein
VKYKALSMIFALLMIASIAPMIHLAHAAPLTSIYALNPGPASRPAKWTAGPDVADQGTNNFKFNTTDTPSGSNFFVNVTLTTTGPLKAWGFGLIYDNTTLQYVSAWRPTDHVFSGTEINDGTSMVAPAVVIADFDATHQEVQWGCSYIMPVPPFSFNGTGQLAQVQFKIKAIVNSTNPIVTSTFDFDPAWTGDYYHPSGADVPNQPQSPAATFTYAVPTVANGTINGWVTNVTNAAIAGATITTNGTGVNPALTNGAGFYAISAPPGTYNVTASATGYLTGGPKTATITSGATTTVNFTLTAVPAAPDFSISASPPTLTIVHGTKDNSTVTVTGLNGFAGTVSLTVSPAQGNSTPAGTLLTLISPLTSPFPAKANLTVAIASSAPAGDFWLNVTGTSGSLVHSAFIHVNVLTGLPIPEPSVIVGVLLMFFAFAAFYVTRKRRLHLIRNH